MRFKWFRDCTLTSWVYLFQSGNLLQLQICTDRFLHYFKSLLPGPWHVIMLVSFAILLHSYRWVINWGKVQYMCFNKVNLDSSFHLACLWVCEHLKGWIEFFKKVFSYWFSWRWWCRTCHSKIAMFGSLVPCFRPCFKIEFLDLYYLLTCGKAGQ